MACISFNLRYTKYTLRRSDLKENHLISNVAKVDDNDDDDAMEEWWVATHRKGEEEGVCPLMSFLESQCTWLYHQSH